MTETMFRLRMKMATPPNNDWYADLTPQDVNDLVSSPQEIFTGDWSWLDDIEVEVEKEARPAYCPKTKRKLTYDIHTGEALDAETLIPIDNFVDFNNKPIL